MKTAQPSKRMLIAGILSIAMGACSGGTTIGASGGTSGAGGSGGSGGTTGAGGSGSGGTSASGGSAGQAGTGGATGSGGQPGTGGRSGSGGSSATGGTTGSGGQTRTGGATGSGGGAGAGGATASGGTTGTAGQTGAGGAGGTVGRDGGRPDVSAGTGGAGTGGAGSGGRTGAGGAATGGSTSTGTGTSTVDCSATMPTGGTDHCGSNTQGNAGGQAWSLWCNQLSGSACITTFSTTAFSARWSNNSDFLARVGLEFGERRQGVRPSTGRSRRTSPSRRRETAAATRTSGSTGGRTTPASNGTSSMTSSARCRSMPTTRPRRELPPSTASPTSYSRTRRTEPVARDAAASRSGISTGASGRRLASAEPSPFPTTSRHGRPRAWRWGGPARGQDSRGNRRWHWKHRVPGGEGDGPMSR